MCLPEKAFPGCWLGSVQVARQAWGGQGQIQARMKEGPCPRGPAVCGADDVIPCAEHEGEVRAGSSEAGAEGYRSRWFLNEGEGRKTIGRDAGRDVFFADIGLLAVAPSERKMSREKETPENRQGGLRCKGSAFLIALFF